MPYFPSTKFNVALSMLLLFKKAQEDGVTTEEVGHIKNYLYLATLCSGSQGKRWFYGKGQQILTTAVARSNGRPCKFSESRYHYLGEIIDSATDTFLRTSNGRFARAVEIAEAKI